MRLTVSDTGPGISPEDQEQIFEPFFRTTEADKHAVPGSGLGLSIVKAIVTAHGGTLDVFSTVGNGTSFTVWLPAAAVATAAAA